MEIDHEKTQKLAEQFDAEIRFRPLTPVAATVVSVLLVSLSVFHYYTAGFGLLREATHRGVHLAFVLSLIFLVFGFSKAHYQREPRPSLRAPGGVPGPQVLRFVQEVQESVRQSDAHLTDIMLAQNFHDLTGQVMARVATLVEALQTQLLQLLLETLPEADKPGTQPGLAGPVIDPDKAPDALASQTQVDDLLASLGF